MDTILNFEYGVDTNHTLTEDDKTCFNEISQVLKKYKAINRFGVTLLDNNQDLPQNQVYLETNDRKGRTLVCSPVSKEDRRLQEVVQTNWQFNTLEATAFCSKGCQSSSGNEKTGREHTDVHIS